MATDWKNYHFILSERSEFHISNSNEDEKKTSQKLVMVDNDNAFSNIISKKITVIYKNFKLYLMISKYKAED